VCPKNDECVSIKNPVDVTMALNKGARMQGVRVLEGVRAAGVTSATDASRINKYVTGVRLADGSVIKCKTVVNAAGMWARQFGELCGVNVPNQAAEHYYIITEPMKGLSFSLTLSINDWLADSLSLSLSRIDVDPAWPVIEDPASYTAHNPCHDSISPILSS
jgi:glycine/D-amino acid oxidase-like deaminating enzyme